MPDPHNPGIRCHETLVLDRRRTHLRRLATEAAEEKTHVSPAATPTAVAAPARRGGQGRHRRLRPRPERRQDRSVKPGDDFFAYANGTWEESFDDPGRQVQLRAVRAARRAVQAARARPHRGGRRRARCQRHAAAADRRLLHGLHGRGGHRGQRPDRRPSRSSRRSAPSRAAPTSRACSAPSASPRCSTCSCRRTSRIRTATRC